MYRSSSVSLYFRMLFPISLQAQISANTILSLAHNKYLGKSRIDNSWNICYVWVGMVNFLLDLVVPAFQVVGGAGSLGLVVVP